MGSVALTFVGLLVAIIGGVTLAQRVQQPYPIVLVIGGGLLAFIPGLPSLELDPELVLVLVLPPLVYAAAWFTSWRDFVANIRSIALLSLALVIVTVLLVATAAHLLGLGWPAAFILGAVVSPTDTVATSAIAQRIQLPRRVVSIVEGESLVNDATGLIAYRFAVAAAVAGTFSFPVAVGNFLMASIGGVAIGVVIALGGAWLHRRISTSTTSITLSFLIPYLAYLPAERLGVSGVLAVATAGIFLGRRESSFFTPEVRLQALAVWEIVIFFLNSILFILLGFQLRTILDLSSRSETLHLMGMGLVVGLVVMAVRLAWVFPGSWLAWKLGVLFNAPRLFAPNYRQVTVVGWMGMRGVVSLAAALAIPLTTARGVPLPGRAAILFLTFAVILMTLLAQGLSLPFVIRRLGVAEDGTRTDEEQLARRAMIQAALNHLATFESADDGFGRHIEHLRTHYTTRLAFLDGRNDQAIAPKYADKHARKVSIEISALEAGRLAVINLRNDGTISDDILHDLERELDYEAIRVRQG